MYDIKNYERFIEEIKGEGLHWEKIKKRTITLFQVLIDKDLKELVFVLKHYPEYLEFVCDHFRYLYNYSEQVADIYASSELLFMSEGYHHKQFVRNLVRKLHQIRDFDISQIKKFLEELISNQSKLHPIILGFYKAEIENNLTNSNAHILQKKAIEKVLKELQNVDNSFDFKAKDRDALMDIPYME